MVHFTVSLGSRKESSRQDKRSFLVARSSFQAIIGRHLIVKTVEIVNIAVFPAAIMYGVFMHGDLGAIEHRHLVMKLKVKVTNG